MSPSTTAPAWLTVGVVGDLKFYAPKSVSVLFALADADASNELAASHDAAVLEAVSYLEDDALLVDWPGFDSDFEPGRGLVAASYRHRMTRWRVPAGPTTTARSDTVAARRRPSRHAGHASAGSKTSS